MNTKDLVLEISKQAKLDNYDSDMLLHDINNLRGNEWLDIVENHCTKDIIKAFKEKIL